MSFISVPNLREIKTWEGYFYATCTYYFSVCACMVSISIDILYNSVHES